MTTVTHIHDRAASPEFRASILALHDPEGGVVVAVTRPGTVRDAGLFGIALQAIGKSTAGGSSAVLERGPNNAAIYLSAWLDALGIQTLILLDADLAHPDQLRSACATAVAIGTNLVLASDGNLSMGCEKAIFEWTNETLDPAEGAALLATIERAPRLAPQHLPLTGPDIGVPATDFFTFRSDAKEMLDPAEFEIIDQLYRDTFNSFQVLAGSSLDWAPEVHRHVTQTLSPNLQTVIIRAIQAKAFLNGFLVDIDLPGLLSAVGPSAAVRLLTDAQWKTISRGMRPVPAAIAGLTAAGLAPSAIALLPRSAVDPSGATVNYEGADLVVPDGAQPAVRAQYLVHQLAHLDADDPFIWDTSRKQVRDVAAALNDLTREYGIKVRTRHSRNDTQHWQYQSGLNITDLAA